MSSYSTRQSSRQISNDAISVSSTQSELLLREFEMCGSDERAFREQVFEGELRMLNGGVQLSFWERFSMSKILLLPVICSVISDILAFYMFEHVSPSTYSIVKQVRLLFCSLMYRFALDREITPYASLSLSLPLSVSFHHIHTHTHTHTTHAHTHKSSVFNGWQSDS